MMRDILDAILVYSLGLLAFCGARIIIGLPESYSFMIGAVVTRSITRCLYRDYDYN